MNIKRHIPNFLTCCNLLCGCLGIITAMYSPTYEFLATASLFMFAAGIFDFLDGFVARLLKVSSPIGKELDSLADMITFGLLPGVIIYKLIEIKIVPPFPSPIPYQLYYLFNESSLVHYALPIPSPYHTLYKYHPFIELIALIIPVFSALRLAKFNIDTRQAESFIGVPTPANAILIASFPLILMNQNHAWVYTFISDPYFLIALSIIMSLLLVSELPLFALKFKSFKWADNRIRFTFLITSLLLIVFLSWTAIPIIIFLYIILSVLDNVLNSKKVS